MSNIHLLALKRNKLQKWLLISSGMFFIIAVILFGVNSSFNAKKSTNLSIEPLSEILKTANEKYSNGDFESAIPYLVEAAERGNARAQYSLGYMYQNGEGVNKDNNKAKEYYRLAAKQGHIKSKNALKRIGN